MVRRPAVVPAVGQHTVFFNFYLIVDKNVVDALVEGVVPSEAVESAHGTIGGRGADYVTVAQFLHDEGDGFAFRGEVKVPRDNHRKVAGVQGGNFFEDQPGGVGAGHFSYMVEMGVEEEEFSGRADDLEFSPGDDPR